MSGMTGSQFRLSPALAVDVEKGFPLIAFTVIEVGARSDNDGLWKQTAQLLRRRPGWVVLAVSTPGMPTFWCFARGTRAEVWVLVENGAISIRLGDTDRSVTVNSVNELATWLTDHRPGSLQEPRKTVIDKLKSGQLFTWK
jgi:hypothetical protein